MRPVRCYLHRHPSAEVNVVTVAMFEHGDSVAQLADERYEKRNLRVAIVERIMLVERTHHAANMGGWRDAEKYAANEMLKPWLSPSRRFQPDPANAVYLVGGSNARTGQPPKPQRKTS
jgi:hypothetical protein